ncbi:hypothetical protein OPV22_018410 [Ensete ventricosum]|uniref:Uncharacterized protein n=1 Tax=Ensete ventricosum TaxID=4639 RepID=A0AAV8R1W9_ENSVE|nr:hypothetical protein OPV22_018410 [Ensete ventricosum]
MAAIPGTLVAIMVLALGIVLPAVQAQAPAPSPTSDGTSIDQGIAYLLMLVALVLTLWPPTSSSKPLGSSFMFVREGGGRTCFVGCV